MSACYAKMQELTRRGQWRPMRCGQKMKIQMNVCFDALFTVLLKITSTNLLDIVVDITRVNIDVFLDIFSLSVFL